MPLGTATPVTDEELQRLPRDGRKYELVDGEIRVSPAGMRHGQVAVRLVVRLGAHVAEKNLGEVLDSSTGYRLPGGNVRSPDVSFVQAARLPGGIVPKGFGELAPDLAVEILSPEDDPRALLDKVGEYLKAGVRLVWVIDPEIGGAAAYRSLTAVQRIGKGGNLDGEDVVPGFSCPLAALLA
jgi:Uma2 family endonuclease